MHEIFGDLTSLEMIDKSTFTACLCKCFGRIKTYRYRIWEYGFDSIDWLLPLLRLEKKSGRREGSKFFIREIL